MVDPLGLLLAVVAVTVYPGGLFLGVGAAIAHRIGAVRGGPAIDAQAVIAMMGAGLAASMAALPGSPAAALPPDGGAAPSLVAAGLLLSGGGALVAGGSLSPRRLVALAAMAVPPLLLAVAAASFSLTALAVVPGALLPPARWLTCAALLLAAPLALQPHIETAPWAARAVLMAAVVELSAGLVAPPSLHGWSALLAVGALVAATAGYALLLRLARSALRRESGSLVSLTAACATAAAIVATLART